jgi:hypothetical protein
MRFIVPETPQGKIPVNELDNGRLNSKKNPVIIAGYEIPHLD